MSDSFSEIYRPKNPKQLIGETQKKIAESLLNNVAQGKVIQEVLFSGESGIGKTTIARMYIDAVIGEPYDLQPFNCADKTGIDYIRDEVIGTMDYLPLDANYRVYFLDEIHKLSESAQSSLLVAIEPVPSHVLLVACTTAPEKLIPTLRSRFTEFRLNVPTYADFQKLAKWINIKNPDKAIDDEIKERVIGLSAGNVRQFVKFYQQALDGSFNGDEVEKSAGIELIKLILSSEKPTLSKWFNSVDESGDYVKIAMGMTGYSIAVLKNSNGHLSKAAMAVIKHFGDNPTKVIADKYTFFNRLLAVYEEVTR